MNQLSRDLTALVRTVPGVATVYSSAPVVAKAVGAVLGVSADELVTVSSIGDITATIGVERADAAPEVARAVHAALADAAGAGVRIHVTIASVG